jgi:hypothetical protein
VRILGPGSACPHYSLLQASFITVGSEYSITVRMYIYNIQFTGDRVYAASKYMFIMCKIQTL